MDALGAELETLPGEERELLELLLQKEGSVPGALPLSKRSQPGEAPMSSTQRRLWALQSCNGDPSFGNVDMSFRVQGSFQLSAAQMALNNVIERHEILRTTYEQRDGAWTQRVRPECSLPFCILDLRRTPSQSRWQTALQHATDLARRPFDLATEMPIRAACIRLDERETLLSFVVHHMAIDGWGMRLFLQEFSGFYSGYANGRGAQLPNLPVQYADYAAWELQCTADEKDLEEVQYWRQQLAGVESLQLPILQSGRSGELNSGLKLVSLGPELSAQFRAFSRNCGVTLFTTFSAVLGLLFYLRSRQQDLAIGIIISNRNRPETERLIGNFGNRLFLRLRIREGITFLELLDQTREVVLGAQAHAEFPLEKLEPEIPLPTFNFLFVMRDSLLSENLQLPGLEVRSVALDIGTPLVDLKLDLAEGEEEICGTIEYRKPQFSGEWIDTIWRDFVSLIEKATADPQMPIAAAMSALTGMKWTEVGAQGK